MDLDDRCEHCGREDTPDNPTHHSVQRDAWLCLTCYSRPVPLKRRVFCVVGPSPAQLAQVCRRVGRTTKDGSVRKALRELTAEGKLTRQPDGSFVGAADTRVDLPA